MNKKKILILIDWYEPGFKAGGPIQSCRNFVRAMFEEFDLALLTSDRDLGEAVPYPGIQTNEWIERDPGIKVYYANTKTLLQKKLLELITEVNPDFIYLNSMYSTRFSVIPLLIAWRRSINNQIVLAPRGMLQDGAMHFKTIKKKIFIRILNFLNLPRRIRFHATDDQEVKDIQKYFPNAKSIHEVSNFSAPLPGDSHFIEKIPGHLKAVYISRISPKKNINFFLDLLGQLPSDVQLDFDIFGEVEDNVYWEQARRIISSLPENIRVVQHGALPHEEVNATLEANHIFILPSKGENYGHAIFESWSASRPCLISDKTPWHNLKKELTGWDLSLSDKQLWINALIEAAEWEQDSFESWGRNCRAFATNRMDQFNLKQAYLQLFS